MRIRLNLGLLAALALAFPVAAMADLAGTPTLATNTALNLDTGATSSSGGDILWTGTALTPQSAATMFTSSSVSGAGTFALFTQPYMASYAALYTKSAIPASTLVVGTIIWVHTNGGHYAAVLITSISVGSIGLQFETFGVINGPTITEVENNYDGVPTGFSNSGIAQGAIFFVVGSQLAAPGTVAALQNSSTTLPASINGATIKVTVGSTTVTPAMYYAQPTAVAGILPSNTPLGVGFVTVTYNNQTSNSYPITVVASAFGFDTYNEQGTGLGIATTPAGVLYNYINSIPPGTTVVLWGSGLGADPLGTGGDTTNGNRDTIYVPGASSINGLAHIYVGGVDGGSPGNGVPGHQGASGFPGLNQINFTIPANAPTGCNVSLVGVNAQGIPTNVITLPIGTGTCSDPAGINGGQLSSGKTNVGSVGLSQVAVPGLGVQTSSLLTFQKQSGSLFVTASGAISIGSCIVNQSVEGSVGSFFTPLDAGTITLTNPSGTTQGITALPDNSGEYYALLPASFIPTTGGTFTFKGAGGADVGPFTATVVFPNPVLTWTNQAAAAKVTRSAGLPITWTGGASDGYVTIIGGVSAAGASGTFTCVAPVSAGQFTIPSYILLAMPAGSGYITVENETNLQTFQATGLDFGSTFGYAGVEANSTFN